MNIELSEFVNILPAWEIGHVGIELQRRSKALAHLYTDREWWGQQPVIRAADATLLWTGQSTVKAARVAAMPDVVWLDGEGDGLGDAWCQLPVAFVIGRRRVLRDGHHRLVKQLQTQQSVSYVLVR